MSIKKFFDQQAPSRQYLTEKDKKEAFKDIESAENLKQQRIKQNSLLPQVEYLNPENFAKFGSAYMYYKGAIERIVDYYPYDGSEAEITSFYNKSLPIEKYIFDRLYPRTNGYVSLNKEGYGSVALSADGYGRPTNYEYITFYGGPNVVSSLTKLKDMEPNPLSSKFQHNNVYDTDIYDTEGLKSDYGKGTRESNLKSNFDTGVTVEFWIKTGSLDTSFGTKQVIFDMWNNEAISSDAYGRLTIELTSGAGAGNPLLITAQSGAASSSAQMCFTSSLGQNLGASDFSEWGHYAIKMYNSGTSFVTDLYVNGYLNDTNVYASSLNELNSKNMIARIGGLTTAPSGSSAAAGSGKLSASLDEFRFWKVARTGEEIGKNWFGQIRGGVNTDISNAELGMYYKFNEGITGITELDSVVLDYGGRLCNGTWTGYTTTSRNTGSAMLSASAAFREYEDPIIYSQHPAVANLKAGLLATGSYHDEQNAGLIRNLLPSWLTDEFFVSDMEDIDKVCHILGAYFDKLHLMIGQVVSLKHLSYTSASAYPLPFAQHLPQHLGLYTPDIFVDASILEQFSNKTEKKQLEGDLTHTKNLIYSNLYNNLASIYKAKGTEKAVRNVLRCFNLNDTLIRYNVYSNNQQYELRNNLKQVLKKKTYANFNTPAGSNAVVYQAEDPHTSSRGYISGTNASGYEDRHGMTAEASILFPRFFRSIESLDRNFVSASLYGMQTVNSASTSDTAFLTGAQDVANFQVYAVKDDLYSKNAHFVLTSAIEPYNIPTLTSSMFFDVYDENNWNFAVKIKPSNYPFSDLLSGSGNSLDTYDVIFRGTCNNLGTVLDSFEVSSSITAEAARNFLKAHKRMYAGARATNITGTVISPSDVLVGSVKYWTKFVDNTTLDQHMYDPENYGISASYEKVSALDKNVKDTHNFNTLALNWYFGNVTSSDSSGVFYATDFSSGSVKNRNAFGWMGNISSYLHPAKGYRFDTDSTKSVDTRNINEFKFIDPEQVVSSDMVQILDSDDEIFGIVEQVPNYVYTIEKSLYASVSEEILDFFAGAVDFHNLIGQPVNRYRERYKNLDYLRRIYYERVKETATVERFTEYYKWFDDALAMIIAQLVPASADFVNDTYNTIESHILERNKYKTQFPTIEFRKPDPEPVIFGIGELIANYEQLSTPLPSSPRRTDVKQRFWQRLAETDSTEITSGDVDIDNARQTIKEIVWSTPYFSGSPPTLSNLEGINYRKSQRLASQRYETYMFDATVTRNIKGGTNFDSGKNIGYTYNNLYPAGPVHAPSGGVYVPQNVLLAENKDFVDARKLRMADRVRRKPTEKMKRLVKVQSGRNHELGLGYTGVKSTVAFPFNIMSSSVTTGFNKQVVNNITSGIEITNLHNDVYGEDMERPMQGIFSEYAVGGHQSRHIGLNIKGTPAVGSIEIVDADSIVDGDTITLGGVTFTWRTSSTSLDKEITVLTTGGTLAVRNLQNAILLGNKINEYFTSPAMQASYPADVATTTSTVSITFHAGRGADTIATSNESAFTVSGFTGGEKGPGNLDDYVSRPEAWKILLGNCPGTGSFTGSIGMVSPDYPWPEANERAQTPYPMTASQKAVYYRDRTAKSPYVFKNIRMRTGSTILGNYQHNYQIVQAAGAWNNPRQFVEIGGQPNLPTASFPGPAVHATQIRTFLDIRRGGAHANDEPSNPAGWALPTGSHFPFATDYDVGYLTGTENKTVISSRFSNPGGLEVSPPGYGDFRSNEFSVYNATRYRNMTVFKPSQAPRGTISEVTGVGGPGIRVFDIHGMDYGLRSHLGRHTARFGRDSLIYPPDDLRPAYDLNKPFIGYGNKNIYRANESLRMWWKLNVSTSNVGYVEDWSGNGVTGSWTKAGGSGIKRFQPLYVTNLWPSNYIQTASFSFISGSPDQNASTINLGSSTLWDSIIGNNTSAGATKKFTLAARVYYNSGSHDENLAASERFPRIFDFSDDVRLFVRYDSGSRGGRNYGFDVKFDGNSAGNRVQFNSPTGSFQPNTWQNIMLTFDGATPSPPTFYIDGVSQSMGHALSPDWQTGSYNGIDTSFECYLGNEENHIRSWSGSIADVAVWDRVLTQEEAAAWHQAARGPNEARKNLKYFGPGSTNNFPGFHKIHRNPLRKIKKTVDEVYYEQRNYNTGAVNENTLVWQWPRTGADNTSNDMKLWHSGSLRKCIINPVTGMRTCANITTKTFTIGLWVLFGEGNSQIIDLISIDRDTSQNNRAALALSVESNSNSNLPRVMSWNGSNNGKWVGSTELQTDNWYHIVMTFDGSSANNNPKIYVDGVADTISEQTAPDAAMVAPNSVNSGKSIIGAYENAQVGAATPWDNLAISEVFMYDTVLTADEVYQIYNEGNLLNLTASDIAPQVDSLFTWLRMGDTKGTQFNEYLHDLSGSNTALSSGYTTTSLYGEAHTVYDVRGNNHYAFWNAIEGNANPGSFPSGTLQTEGSSHPYHFTASYADITRPVGPFKNVQYSTFAADYDNFFVQHMIPRSDKQYRFFSSSIVNNGEYRFEGYMPTVGGLEGSYSSSATNGVVPFFNFVSMSEIGAYMGGDVIAESETRPGQEYMAGHSQTFASYNRDWMLNFVPGDASAWMPQPCNHLNLNIYEPITSSTSTLGWPLSTPLARSNYDSTPTPAAAWPNNDNAIQYRNTTMVSASRDEHGGLKTGKLGIAGHFNMLMFKRNGQYGWTPFAQTHQNDHPVLYDQRKKNIMMLEYDTPGVQQEFPLRPVSLKGRPIRINYDYKTQQMVRNSVVTTTQNTTLKTSYNNEFIYFNSRSLDNQLNIPEILKTEVTPFEQMLVLKEEEGFHLNWIHYTENIYPSLRNEFSPTSSFRPNYDNRMWRTSLADRIDVGSISIGTNSFGVTRISQSCWPLDAPAGFLTRLRSPMALTVTGTDSGGDEIWFRALSTGRIDGLRIGGAVLNATNSVGTVGVYDDVEARGLYFSGDGVAGELQNTYGWWYPTSSNAFGSDHGGYSTSRKWKSYRGDVQRRYPSRDSEDAAAHSRVFEYPLADIAPAALYARKQTLASPLSINSPNYPNVSCSVQDLGVSGGYNPNWQRNGKKRFVDDDPEHLLYFGFTTASQGAGEAYWDAPRTAGYITSSIVYDENLKPSRVTGFVSASSKPWYNNYDAYKENLKLIARGYSVIPEFRISERLERYLEAGGEDFADFTIPGSQRNSAQKNFYKDFSNSDFLGKFLNIRNISNLHAREFKLTCNAVVKFNPYKGFYPVDRTLQIVSQFSKSYGNSISISISPIDTEESVNDNFDTRCGLLRPVLQPLFAPGILYNSIKAGIACDWPVISDGDKITSLAISGSDSPSGGQFKNGINYAWTVNTNTFESAFATGSLWDKRLPFETIINPGKYMEGLPLIDMEPHPDSNIGDAIALTCSVAPAGNSLYTLMAGNFVAEVGDFFLTNGNYTKLKGKGVSATAAPLTFPSGSVYGSRLRLRTSHIGERTYEYESGAFGDNTWFTKFGAGAVYLDASTYTDRALGYTTGTFELPQDPARNPNFERNFVMYSRTTAFGPPFVNLSNDDQIEKDYNIWSALRDFLSASESEVPGISYIRSGAFGSKDVTGAISFISGGLHAWREQQQFNMIRNQGRGVMDAINGYNWAWTPPYYHGEAWCDFIFRPDHTRTYTLENILAETKTVFSRFDPGPQTSSYIEAFTDVIVQKSVESDNSIGVYKDPANEIPLYMILFPDFTGSQRMRNGPAPYRDSTNTYSFPGTTFSSLMNDCPRTSGSGDGAHGGDYPLGGPGQSKGMPAVSNFSPYRSTAINANAMQISSSFNLFGVENIYNRRFDKFGREILSDRELVGKRWVIQPKFETPMLNFSRNNTVHPISASGPGSNKTVQIRDSYQRTKGVGGSTSTATRNNGYGFGADTAADGMWHQFGVMPTERNEGIFLEMTDIPDTWLQYHYSVVSESSVYNNFDPMSVGGEGVSKLHTSMKSFADLMGFVDENSKVRLGEIAEEKVIKEAVVAIPYIQEHVSEETGEAISPGLYWKKFINIPHARIEAAMASEEGSEAGDSLDAAGPSIRRMVDKMQDYILPPKFDFLRNPAGAEPIVMYFFEFEYRLDQDDLSYIWQNIAPRKHEETYFQQDVVAHELFDTELLTESNLMENPDLRWMVFKVKQKSQKTYRDKVLADFGSFSVDPTISEATIGEYDVLPNWPYDYLSIVELVKMEAEVLYKDPMAEIEDLLVGEGLVEPMSAADADLMDFGPTGIPPVILDRGRFPDALTPPEFKTPEDKVLADPELLNSVLGGSKSALGQMTKAYNSAKAQKQAKAAANRKKTSQNASVQKQKKSKAKGGGTTTVVKSQNASVQKQKKSKSKKGGY